MRIRQKVEHLVKHNPVVQFLYRTLGGAFFRFIGLFVRTDDKLVLMNGHGFRYNDSPRAIYVRMRELGLVGDGGYRVVWALKQPDRYDIPGAEKIRMDTPEYFITALKAKYWISCVNIERGMRFKKKKTVYLNTWHGASLNYVGNAVEGRNDFHFEHINYFCYNGEYERDFIIRDFNVLPGALIPTGYPRNDELYAATDADREKYRKLLNIPDGKKVILYAPTWRESTDGGRTCPLAPPIDWALWKSKLGDRYVMLVRTHPYTTELMHPVFDDFARNACDYPEVNHLLICADVLISDYSCIQLDYAILKKPEICYGYDYDEYVKQRGFYIDMEREMTNGVIRSQQDVISLLLDMDEREQSEKTARLAGRYMEYGGHATDACIKAVFGILQNGRPV